MSIHAAHRPSDRVGRSLGVVSAALLAALAGCSDSPSGPPTSIPVEFQVSADIGEGEPGRSVGVAAFYRRTSGEEVALTVDPVTIDVETGSIAAGSITVDVLPCVNDPNREAMSASSTDGCRVHLVVGLLAANGAPVSEEEIVVSVARSARSVAVEPIELSSGELLPSAASVDLVMIESGQLPPPATVTIASSTVLEGGPLSATIQYLSGSGWLTVTVPPGEGSVTIAPASATLAPGTYEAIVRVTSARRFEPAEIAVSYQVPKPPEVVTITGAGNGTGLVLVTPGGAQCTTTAGQMSDFCSVPRPHGSIVTLTPAPAIGSAFTGWSGACAGTEPCTLTMDQARAVTVTFTIVKYDLTVSAAGSGSGAITSAPAGVSCTAAGGQASGTCVAPFDHPTQVTVAATPASGSEFLGWSGACQGTGACVVTMTEARNVTATFGIIQRQLSVTMSGGGAGTVTSSPAGITCTVATGESRTCTASFDHGTVVVLAASPGTGATFQGWSGSGCSGSGTCTVTMNQARSVTAAMNPPTYPLKITYTGNFSGSVTYSPQPVSCGTEGCQFPHGTVVRITATVGGPTDFNYTTFGGFSGDCTGGGSFSKSGACTLTMDGPKAVTVEFNVYTAKYTVTASGSGSGSVSGGQLQAGSQPCDFVAGSGSCTLEFIVFQDARFTATPAPGSVFGGFSGTCAGGSPCVISAFTIRPLSGGSLVARFDLAPQPAPPDPLPRP